MSAKEKQVVEVQEKLDDITECPICTKTFKESKILPCIHTFCMLCLQQTGLKTSKSPGDKMPCPVCRTEFTIPEKGFNGLQRNFFMERLIEMKNILNPSSAGALCDACREENDLDAEAELPSADMYCADCNQRLCAECCKNHRKSKASKDHRLLSLDGAQVNIPSIVKQCVCDKHENKPLEIYCSTCQEAVCALCFYKSHKWHDTSPVIEVVAEFRKIIQENADSMMKCVFDLKQRTTNKDNDKEMFVEKVSAVESEIKRIRQNLQKCAERDCDILLQQLNSVKQERIKENESQQYDIEAVLASLESYQTYCLQVTSVGSEVDICRAVHILRTRATDLKQCYESLSFRPFPTIWLRNTEFQNAFFQHGKNIIGKIEEFGENQILQAENSESLLSRITSVVDDLNDILINSSDEAKKDDCQSKQFEDAIDHSNAYTAETDGQKKHKSEEEQLNEIDGKEKERSAEAFGGVPTGEMKEWTKCIHELSDKPAKIKVIINILEKRNNRLIEEIDLHRERFSSLEEVNRVLSRQVESMQLTIMTSDEQIDDLRKQVALLTSIAYDGNKPSIGQKTVQLKTGFKFLRKITPVDVSVYNEEEYRVTGLAIIDNELFVASTSNVVDVTDLRTLKFKRRWRAEGMSAVVDMKACARIKCIYLLCRIKMGFKYKEASLLRFSAMGKVIKKWDLGSIDFDHAQISVTAESNVLLANENKLREYSPDGNLIRTISLEWESGIKNLVHAIKLTSGHFVLCHGRDEDSLQRVCMVDVNGNVLKYFGEVGRSDKLKHPMYLEMASGGNILVADHFNRRVLILNSRLKLVQELSPFWAKHNLGELSKIESRPQKLILDEANGRVFVAENTWKTIENDERIWPSGDELSAFIFPRL